MYPRIKICCIASLEEARLAVASGASALGLVSAMPSGPGPIPESLISQIARAIPPAIGTFLLTCETTVVTIVQQHFRTCTNTIQLVDALADGSHQQLRAALPSVKIVQVIHVRNERSVIEATALSRHVDALLLDSGNPELAVKELGGTGRIHDWSLSRRIREASACPVFLAGGLRPENVREAIVTVQPFGVDVCSGVRTDGRLDAGKVQRFIASVMSA